ncbi:MAG TPA: dihydrodipicolinate synthase family protein [Chloroflexota bacterium]|nr:dihydrodipicolinate synthase family protein [Chloroflexota bacterium]
MSGLPTDFSGIVPPVSTPMTEDYEVDTASLERLITFLIDEGVSGLFMLGSTSETAFLTNAQRVTVIETALRVAAGRVPVLAGIIDMTTARCIEHARAAQRAGVDALVLTAPFYMQPSQEEILEHFRAVHLAVDLPILAYDIPVAVHVKLPRQTIMQLAQEGVIIGVKDSSGNEGEFRALAMERKTNPRFRVFTGSELLIDNAVYMGASGAVPGLSNVDPAGFVRLYRAARANDWETARSEQERIFRLFAIVRAATPGRMGGGSAAFGAFKTALMLRGVIATNVVGRPQLRLEGEEIDRVRHTLVEVGLL